MVEAHAVLQVADGVLDLGVAAMVSLEIQGVALPVGNEGVIAVGGEERQLGAGRGLGGLGYWVSSLRPRFRRSCSGRLVGETNFLLLR